MRFKRKDETLDFGPYWHLDCRLAAELPEDNVVRARFLADALFGAIAFGLLLLCLWLGYGNTSVSGSIRDWDRRMADQRAEMEALQKVQQDISRLGNRITQATELTGSPYLLSHLLLDLGRTRPSQVRIDVIQVTERMLYLRGNISETSDRATRVLGLYVQALRADPAIGPHFAEITPSSIDRVNNQSDAFSFEVTLRKK